MIRKNNLPLFNLTLFRVALLCLATAMFAACGDNNKKSNPNVVSRVGGNRNQQGGPATGLNGPVPQSPTSAFGVVQVSQSGNMNGNDLVRSFLSTDLLGQEVGGSITGIQDPTFQLPCMQGAKSPQGQPLNSQCAVGVSAIGGSGLPTIRLQGGATLNQAISNQQGIQVMSANNDPQQGGISIVVWDSLTGNGNDPIPATIPIVSGLVRGNCSQQSCQQGSQNSVELVFQDGVGRVTLSGSVIGNTLTAQVSFQNTQNKNPQQAPAVGTLGQLTTNICALFTCQ